MTHRVMRLRTAPVRMNRGDYRQARVECNERQKMAKYFRPYMEQQRGVPRREDVLDLSLWDHQHGSGKTTAGRRPRATRQTSANSVGP
jgi:hypothetical protein